MEPTFGATETGADRVDTDAQRFRDLLVGPLFKAQQEDRAVDLLQFPDRPVELFDPFDLTLRALRIGVGGMFIEKRRLGTLSAFFGSGPRDRPVERDAVDEGRQFGVAAILG